MAATPSSTSISAGHDYSHWTEALANHPIFTRLAEECYGNDECIAICQSRGDLFVWDPKYQHIVTANIKRLHGNISTTDESSSSIVSLYNIFLLVLYYLNYLSLVLLPTPSPNYPPSHSPNLSPLLPK